MSARKLKPKRLDRVANSLRRSKEWRSLVDAVIQHYGSLDFAVACGVDWGLDYVNDSKIDGLKRVGVSIPTDRYVWHVVSSADDFRRMAGIVSVSPIYCQWVATA